MKLYEILRFFNINSDNNTEVNDIVFDIDKIKNNSIFILIKEQDKSKINKILKKNPLLIISEFDLKKTVYIPNLKELLTPLFLYFYRIDFSKINIIAITGTEMKSSIAKLLFDSLNMSNRKSLLLSTSFKGENIITTELTTPQGNDLAKYIKFAIDNDYQNFIFEASSISIEEYRLNGIKINEIILTNLNIDHLDYHKTIEYYYKSKSKILKMSKKIYAFEEEINKLNDRFEYIKINKFNNIEHKYKYLNSYHLLGISYVISYLKENNIEVDLSNIKYPEGRYDVILDKPHIVIDYAHSSFAFEKVCKYFSNNVKGKKIIVFGAGGDREKEKRFIYSKTAYKLFDIAIVTEDNSRNEKFKSIKNDIISINPNFFKVIKNRKKAVKYALSLINNENDGVIFIGKGIENYINKKNKHIPYNEKEYVISYINKYYSSKKNS